MKNRLFRKVVIFPRVIENTSSLFLVSNNLTFAAMLEALHQFHTTWQMTLIKQAILGSYATVYILQT